MRGKSSQIFKNVAYHEKFLKVMQKLCTLSLFAQEDLFSRMVTRFTRESIVSDYIMVAHNVFSSSVVCSCICMCSLHCQCIAPCVCVCAIVSALSMQVWFVSVCCGVSE